MGRNSHSQTQKNSALNDYFIDLDEDTIGPAFWKRKRPTRHQAPPPTLLDNVDVYGILFAIVTIVFVIHPLAEWALGR